MSNVPVKVVDSKANTALAVPQDMFSGDGALDTGVKDTGSRPTFAYIGFRGEKAKSKAGELDAAGVGDNEFYIGDAAGLLKVKPFTLHLMSYAWFFTQLDKNGMVNDIKTTSTQADYDKKFRKHLLGLAAVKTAGGLVLATFGQRNAMVQGFQRAIDLLKDGGAARDAASWAKRSAAHAKTADLPWPMFRFQLTLWAEAKEAQDGNVNVSSGSIQPTPEADLGTIRELMGPKFETVVAPITQHYLRRVTEWKRYAALTDEQKKTAQLPY